MAKITYTDKVTMNENADIPAINKVKATDMNEIKSVINENDDNVGTLSSLPTTDKSSAVAALSEIYDDVFYSSGDTYTIPGQLYVSGALLGNRNIVTFTHNFLTSDYEQNDQGPLLRSSAVCGRYREGSGQCGLSGRGGAFHRRYRRRDQARVAA